MAPPLQSTLWLLMSTQNNFSTLTSELSRQRTLEIWMEQFAHFPFLLEAQIAIINYPAFQNQSMAYSYNPLNMHSWFGLEEIWSKNSIFSLVWHGSKTPAIFINLLCPAISHILLSVKPTAVCFKLNLPKGKWHVKEKDSKLDKQPTHTMSMFCLYASFILNWYNFQSFQCVCVGGVEADNQRLQT